MYAVGAHPVNVVGDFLIYAFVPCLYYARMPLHQSRAAGKAKAKAKAQAKVKARVCATARAKQRVRDDAKNQRREALDVKGWCHSLPKRTAALAYARGGDIQKACICAS